MNKRSRMMSGMLRIVLVVVAVGAWTGPDSLLPDAAMRGADLAALQALLDAGADIAGAQGDGMTALHWVAKNGDVEAVRLMVDAGAPLTATTRLGKYTPLHLASESGHGAVIRLLLEAGSDANALTASGGASALHLAARAGTAEGVRALVEHGADLNHRESVRAQTPLMFGAAFGRTEAVRLLAEAGADLSAATKVIDVPGFTELNRQARAVRDSVLTAFREAAGQEDDPNWSPSPREAQEAARLAWEFHAHARVEVDPETYLQSEGYYADWARRVGTMGGLTALLYAVRDGHAETALALLDAGADINQVGAGDATSPLLMAAIHGRYDLAVELLSRGADPNIRNTSGDQPLFATIETRWAPHTFYPSQHHWMDQKTTHVELVAALLEAGADADARLTRRIWYSELNRSDLGVNFAGSTAFFRAAHALDLEVMKLLVGHGADPDIPTFDPDDWWRGGGNVAGASRERDRSGLPPGELGGPGAYAIHAASGAGHGQAAAGNSHRHVPDGFLPAVRYLVEELGADINMRDHGGFTPLHNAAARGDDELIMYLVENGADVTAVSRRGLTTADMANSPFITQRPIPRTVALLESLGSHNNNICLACGDARPDDEGGERDDGS